MDRSPQASTGRDVVWEAVRRQWERVEGWVAVSESEYAERLLDGCRREVEFTNELVKLFSLSRYVKTFR